MMHWTLQALIGLCIICAALNVAQKAMVGSVRLIGILICASWMIQQSWWAFTGSDNLVIILACDAVIAGWLWSRWGCLDRAERIIAAILPVTVACYLWQFAFGESAMRWWLNWSLVASQMVIGLPSLNMGRGLHNYSHGPLRPISEA